MAIPIPDVPLERNLPRTFSLTLYFSDPDRDRLTYAATTSDPLTVGVSVTDSEVTLTPLRDGSATVTVTARDPGGLSASQTFTVTVGAANQPPTAVGTIPHQTLTPGGSSVTVDLTPRFSDPDGDQLTFRVASSDSGVVSALLSESGLILVPVAAGTATVTVTATDPGGLSATLTFEVTVGATNRTPLALGEIPDRSLAAGGSAATLDIAGRFTDPDGDQLIYSATSSDSEVVRAVLSGTELVLIPVAVGTATVTVTATDPGGLSVTQTFEVTVGAPNRAPTAVGSIPDQRLTAGGSPVTLDVAPNFSDPNGDQLGFEATSSDSGVVRALVSENELILLPVATGTATVTVVATDPGGLSATHSFRVTVGVANRQPVASGVIPDQTLVLGGNPVDVNIARNFSDPDGDSLTFRATSSDAGVVRVAVSGFELTLIPEGVGTASVRVTATDPGGLTAVQLFHVTVESVRAPATPTGLHVSETGADFIEWRWDPVPGVIGYEVVLSADGSFPDDLEGLLLPPDQTSFVADFSLLRLLGFTDAAYLRVRALAGDLDSPVFSGWTAPVRGMPTVEEPARAPATPTGLRVAETGPDFIEWTWRAVPDVTGYQTQYSANAAFTSTDPIVDLSATDLFYRKENLERDTSHFLRVRSFIDVDGKRYESAWSSHVIGMTAAVSDDHGDTEATATRIRVPSTTEGELETAGDVDYFRFRLLSTGRLAVHTTGTTDTVGVLTGPNGLRVSNDDSGDTNFRIVVAEALAGDYHVAVSGYRTSTGLYELHTTLSANTLAAPRGLRVTDRGEDFIEWSWDEVPDADGYEVQFRRDSNFSEDDRLYPRSGTSITATPLHANTVYYLRIRTVIGAGGSRQESAWTRPVSGRTELDFRIDHRFSRPFWDAIAFDAYECPGEGSCPDYYADGSASRALEDRVLFVLPTTGPNFHIRTHNDHGERRMPSSSARRIRQLIPDAVEVLTGEPYTGIVTTGPEDAERDGWVTIEFLTEQDDPDYWESDDPEAVVCGRARVGAVRGLIVLNSSQISETMCQLDPLTRHEVGHALGFFHVRGNRDVMTASQNDTHHFTSRERYHAQLAYELGRFRPYTSGPVMVTRAEQREAAPHSVDEVPIVICYGR